VRQEPAAFESDRGIVDLLCDSGFEQMRHECQEARRDDECDGPESDREVMPTRGRCWTCVG
jgi:hypothetical protein